jgi:hypothetical protein
MNHDEAKGLSIGYFGASTGGLSVAGSPILIL